METLKRLQPMGWSIWLVASDQTNKTDQIDERDLLFLRLLAAGQSAHHYQYEDGETQEPEAWASIGGIGELDEIGQSPDQQRHTGHHGVAEGRAERDHQKEDACPGHDLARPRVLDGEKEVEQHRTDSDQNDNGVQTAGGTQQAPGKGDAFSRHQRQQGADRILDLFQDKRGDRSRNGEPRPDTDNEGERVSREPGGFRNIARQHEQSNGNRYQ